MDAATLTALGRLSGAAALACFVAAALPSARVPGTDRWFGGLTRLWKVHHLLGAAAFLLAMAHPLLLSAAAGTASARAAAEALFPAGAPVVWAGWASLALMCAFLLPTFHFFGTPHYQRWKSLHALSGAALILAVAHAVPLARTVPAVGWLAAGGAAAAAVLYRVRLARRLGCARYRISAVDRPGRGVVELTLVPEGPRVRFEAGQFVYLTPLDPSLTAGRGEEHPYTVSSAPDGPELKVAVKDLGDATRALQSVAVGSEALVEGPYGGLFTGPMDAVPELWLAGGIGITPFLSRARGLRPGGRTDAVLVFCVQDESRAHFLAELRDIAARVPGLRVVPHFFAVHGALDRAFLEKSVPDLPRRVSYVCGPPPMIALAREALRGAGVPAGRVRAEDFAWL